MKIKLKIDTPTFCISLRRVLFYRCMFYRTVFLSYCILPYYLTASRLRWNLELNSEFRKYDTTTSDSYRNVTPTYCISLWRVLFFWYMFLLNCISIVLYLTALSCPWWSLHTFWPSFYAGRCRKGPGGNSSCICSSYSSCDSKSIIQERSTASN